MNEINRRELMQSAGVLGASAIGANQFIDTVKAQSDGPMNEISGVVETESGPLENATVVAVPHDTSQPVLETTTDSNGEYIFTESDLIEGDNLYIVVAYAGTDSTPLRSEQNYPFVAAEGAPAIPDSGVARWEFEQNVEDSWGDNDGTDNTSAGYVTGQVGSYAKALDGVDDNIPLPTGFLPSSTAYSIVGWVRPDAFDGGSVFNQQDAFGIRVLNGGGFQLYTYGNNHEFSAGLTTGSWHHIAATWDVGTEIKGYHNGSLLDTVSYGDGLDNVTNNAAIGAQIDGSGSFSSYYDGDIDHLDIYSDILTETEVSNHYNTGSING